MKKKQHPHPLGDDGVKDTRFSSVLLRWFRENGRNLPWRETSDPYAIWVSEIILQQTRIQQGWDYWERFMARFPHVEDLASASEDEVLRLWQGLGYYSRARNLHYAAKQIVALGHFPCTMDELLSLKGVGDYTAAAIGSIAFGLPDAVVDGNVYRVLSRYFGLAEPVNGAEGRKLFKELAQRLLPPDEPSAYNQAIMDFGAIQCMPASPRCSLCPLNGSCEALRTGLVDKLPAKLRKAKARQRHFSYVYLCSHGQTAIRKRSAGDIWQGLWEPLCFENQPLPSFAAPPLLLRKGVKHVLTHQALTADFYLLRVNKRPPLPPEYIWIDESDWNRYAVPRLVELLIEAVHAADATD